MLVLLVFELVLTLVANVLEVLVALVVLEVVVVV